MDLINKELNIAELKKLVIEEEDINFLAFVITPWQAHGVYAFFKYAEERQIPLAGHVCIMPSSQAGYVLDHTHFQELPTDVDMLFLNALCKIGNKDIGSSVKGCLSKKSYKNDCKQFYILNLYAPNFKFHSFIRMNKTCYKPISVTLDEGLGKYIRNRTEDFMERLQFLNSFKEKVICAYYSLFQLPFLTRVIARHGELVSFNLFDRKGNRLNLNKAVAMYYRKSLLEEKIEFNYKDIKHFENAVVINTQPFYEMGQILNDEDLKPIKAICAKCRELDLKVVIKMHPREKNRRRYENIEGLIVDGNMEKSQESIIANLNKPPLAVIGFSSTTLISLKVLFGVQTVSLSGLFKKNSAGPRMKLDCNKFYKTFHDIVPCPDSMEAAVSWLESVRTD